MFWWGLGGIKRGRYAEVAEVSQRARRWGSRWGRGRKTPSVRGDADTSPGSPGEARRWDHRTEGFAAEG